ncbi:MULTISPECIES: hypothetical protein [Cohnella]|uniref:hypothetical protein n=1 Tax=Cohnella TaxID=329857 RepID=UPI00159480C8|nr:MULTISPECIES: hypothetical protein [Cohnella]MBN2983421.1 hypothetical protein [Cohnella algarum]
MEEGVILTLALLAMFGLIGAVMLAVARMVREDSLKHDRRFIWTIKDDPGKKGDPTD